MILWNTYFIRSDERDFSGPKDTPIYRPDGTVIAMVPRAFVNDVCVEGSGKLDDGRIINFAASCDYGPACLTGRPICYSTIDPVRFQWGKGSHGNALVPMRSLATFPSDIPFGTYVYMPRWRGVQIPSIDGIAGFTHDGCFRADDVGGWIGHGHIDIFAGSKRMMQAMEHIFPTRTQFEATTSPILCAAAQIPTSSSGLVILGIGAASVAGYYGYRWWKSRNAARRRNPVRLTRPL
jgi:3D (Asp-Asp-Asp) domain-containing protein